ncbi:protein IQ-DOMAIN 31 [Coffea arabica]|uniref:Protein IQ-DOMAIN 31 n=1 Tax=Coffea arabica TaxID=13443 RepID=A0A6P6TAR5_COFAR|nr:protein IQ-DOMAIN 31-like [Coffea arabica]
MGKSPGKWIKTVLFGKKPSKSNLSKGAKIQKKAAPDLPEANLDVSPPVISDTSYQSTDGVGDRRDPEKGVPGGLQGQVASSFPPQLGVDLLDSTGLDPADNVERERQEQAATKAQAAFRGYLARRAFRALKGIIRLQALIRGHLVRRQSVATLCCMQSIVKIQALARGRRVRLSNPELQQLKKCRLHEILGSRRVDLLGVDRASRSEKLATNAFVNKLLASLPTAMPLSLQYDLDEPNAAWNWLERWSLLSFWEPLPRPKKILDAKPQGKQGSRQGFEAEPGKSRRTFRKVATAGNGDNNMPSSLEVEKPRRNPRKPSSHQVESVQEQPQNELERVKRSLRKVSATTTVVSENSEAETEKPQQIVRKTPSLPVSDVTEPVIADLSEKPSEPAVVVDKVDKTEASSELLMVDEPVELPHVACPGVEQQSPQDDMKVEINATADEELSAKEDQSGKENQKNRRRRSFPTKHEYPENVSQNAPSLPSYMLATESAKAKLRAQGSAKLNEDAVENGFVRRHSLPSSTNGKLSSLSPRVQKPAQANGRGGSKTNKSLSASRDERVLQPGWRR